MLQKKNNHLWSLKNVHILEWNEYNLFFSTYCSLSSCWEECIVKVLDIFWSWIHDVFWLTLHSHSPERDCSIVFGKWRNILFLNRVCQHKFLSLDVVLSHLPVGIMNIFPQYPSFWEDWCGNILYMLWVGICFEFDWVTSVLAKDFVVFLGLYLLIPEVVGVSYSVLHQDLLLILIQSIGMMV